MYKYLIAFILYLFLISSYLLIQYDEKKEIYYDNLKNSVKKSLKGSINTFELLNDSYHNRIESQIAKIIKDSDKASKAERDAIRYKLRENFTTLFNNRKLAHLETFHIIDKNSKSILRFHELNKYDDSLLQARKSIKNLSMTFKSQHGFEVGKYATTYRFEYPLFYDGAFVGSYEFGIDFDALDSEMQKIFSIKNILFIHKDSLNYNLIKKNKDYSSIKIEDKKFYMLKTKMNLQFFNNLQTLFKTKEIAHKILTEKVSFVHFQVEGINYIAILSPIQDINKQNIGFMLTGVIDNVTSSIQQTFIEELIISILFGLVILFLIYKEIEYKRYIRNIIDTQHDILIVTDGDKIYDANKKFLTFFNYPSLKEFQKGHTCICNHFLEEKNFIQEKMGEKNWFSYIKENTTQENIAIMYNKNHEKRYFDIKLEGFSHSKNYIVMFNDITEEYLIKQELITKAYYDTLTKIYSRQSFDYHLEKKLSHSKKFSLIMFDIDHFKAVNDNYGHDVGDSVLKELTKLVSSHIREDDIFARWGGEEFMIILNTNITVAERFANKLRKTIEEHHFKYVDTITCSFGISRYKENDDSVKILKRVDTMLYSAKKSGRNCVVVLN